MFAVWMLCVFSQVPGKAPQLLAVAASLAEQKYAPRCLENGKQHVSTLGSSNLYVRDSRFAQKANSATAKVDESVEACSAAQFQRVCVDRVRLLTIVRSGGLYLSQFVPRVSSRSA
jgi:hypothetical protein